jgi:predicted RNA-binding protein with PIN domain
VLACWVIIDGYSLLHRRAPSKDKPELSVARRRLLRDIEDISDALAEKITVVFDGKGSLSDFAEESPHIEVLFSPGHHTADTVIERLVHEAKDSGTVLVVTSDRAERHTVEAAGGMTMGCGPFLEHCEGLRKRVRSASRSATRRAPPSTLGELFP